MGRSRDDMASPPPRCAGIRRVRRAAIRATGAPRRGQPRTVSVARAWWRRRGGSADEHERSEAQPDPAGSPRSSRRAGPKRPGHELLYRVWRHTPVRAWRRVPAPTVALRVTGTLDSERPTTGAARPVQRRRLPCDHLPCEVDSSRRGLRIKRSKLGPSKVAWNRSSVQ